MADAPMRVLIVGKLPPAMETGLRELGLETALAPDMSAAAKLGEAIGVVTSSEAAVQDEHLAAMPGLKFVGRAAAGTDKTKVIKANIWLTDIKTWAEMNEAWDAWVVPGQTPARATVEAALAAPGIDVEIMVEAALD